MLLKKKIFMFMFIFIFVVLYLVQPQKYNYKIVNGKYVINDFNAFLKVFKKALKDKDNETILKLCVKKITYDDENFKGYSFDNESILYNGFDHDLCLRVINNEPELIGDKKKMQAYIPKYERDVDEKYTILLEKWYDNGWFFSGLLLIPYDNILAPNKYAKIYYLPTIDNLRFRESPTLNGKVIRILKKNDVLELIEKGKTETIKGVNGTWVKVKTDLGEEGWCFDAYLKEWKNNVKKK